MAILLCRLPKYIKKLPIRSALVNFLKQKIEIKFNKPLFTTDFFEEYTIKYPILASGISYVKPKRNEVFSEKYFSKYGELPIVTASNAYDATILLLKVLNHKDPIFFLHENDFNTVTFGPITFNEEGGIDNDIYEMVAFNNKS